MRQSRRANPCYAEVFPLDRRVNPSVLPKKKCPQGAYPEEVLLI